MAKHRKRTKNKYLPLVSSLGVAACLTPAVMTTATPVANASGCAPVHIVTVPATGHSDNPQAFVDTMRQQYGNNISTYNVQYPASAGALQSVTAANNSMPTGYGDSRLLGAENALNNVQEVHNNCPDTDFVFYGYSQGASVASNVTSLIAHGAIQGVTSDDIISTILVADPQRRGNSQYYASGKTQKAYAHIPEGYVYQQGGGYATAGMPNGSVGLAGPSSLDYGDAEAKVISICKPDDAACVMYPGQNLNKISDIADKKLIPDQTDRTLRTAQQAMVAHPIMTMDVLLWQILPIFLGGSPGYNTSLDQANYKIDHFIIQPEDRAVLKNLTSEMRQVFDVLHSDEMYGQGIQDVTIVGHIVHQAIPQIDGIPAPQWVKDILKSMLWNMTINHANAIPADIRARVEPVINHSVAFPMRHSSYWRENDSYGRSTSDFVASIMSESIGNYLRGTPIYIPADGRNRGEAPLARMKDDGLGMVMHRDVRSPEPFYNVPKYDWYNADDREYDDEDKDNDIVADVIHDTINRSKQHDTVNTTTSRSTATESVTDTVEETSTPTSTSPVVSTTSTPSRETTDNTPEESSSTMNTTTEENNTPEPTTNTTSTGETTSTGDYQPRHARPESDYDEHDEALIDNNYKPRHALVEVDTEIDDASVENVTDEPQDTEDNHKDNHKDNHNDNQEEDTDNIKSAD